MALPEGEAAPRASAIAKGEQARGQNAFLLLGHYRPALAILLMGAVCTQWWAQNAAANKAGDISNVMVSCAKPWLSLMHKGKSVKTAAL